MNGDILNGQVLIELSGWNAGIECRCHSRARAMQYRTTINSLLLLVQSLISSSLHCQTTHTDTDVPQSLGLPPPHMPEKASTTPVHLRVLLKHVIEQPQGYTAMTCRDVRLCQESPSSAITGSREGTCIPFFEERDSDVNKGFLQKSGVEAWQKYLN